LIRSYFSRPMNVRTISSLGTHYFQIETDAAEVSLHPPLAADFANVPYYVERRAP
jgi:hypothetical protein